MKELSHISLRPPSVTRCTTKTVTSLMVSWIPRSCNGLRCKVYSVWTHDRSVCRCSLSLSPPSVSLSIPLSIYPSIHPWIPMIHSELMHVQKYTQQGGMSVVSSLRRLSLHLTLSLRWSLHSLCLCFCHCVLSITTPTYLSVS